MFNFDENAKVIYSESQRVYLSEKLCQKCGMLLSDVLKTGVVGCAMCYKTFETEIKNLILSRKGTINNVGKIPSKHFSKVKLKEKILELENQKNKAIAEENYIMAESLKNQIEKLKGEN